MFRDREDAGRRLAEALEGRHADIVLGIPRGGMIVARPVASALGAALDVVVTHKLGAPGNPELGIGAVAPDGVTVLDNDLVAALGVSESYLRSEAERQRAEIERRLARYRGARPAPDLLGRTVVVVDDGVATGVTAVAALRWVRAKGAAEVTFAAPVGAPSSVARLAEECDEVVVPEQPVMFVAVGEWYAVFGQTTDEEVAAALAG